MNESDRRQDGAIESILFRTEYQNNKVCERKNLKCCKCQNALNLDDPTTEETLLECHSELTFFAVLVKSTLKTTQEKY